MRLQKPMVEMATWATFNLVRAMNTFRCTRTAATSSVGEVAGDFVAAN
jgi:hypothetical protein